MSPLLEDSMKAPRAVPAGPHLAFAAQLGELIPQVIQFDELRFEASISSAGVVTPAADVPIPNDYDFAIIGYRGYIEEPGVAVVNWPGITWNVKERSKRNVFTSDKSMAELLTILGPMPPFIYPYLVYKFGSGAVIQLPFTFSGTWSGGAKKVGVTLLGALVASRTK